MKAALLALLFAFGTIAFSQVWSRSPLPGPRWLYGAVGILCWAAMAAIGYGTP